MKIKKPLRAAERFGEIVVGGSDQQAQNSRRVSPASRRSSRLLSTLFMVNGREDKCGGLVLSTPVRLINQQVRVKFLNEFSDLLFIGI